MDVINMNEVKMDGSFRDGREHRIQVTKNSLEETAICCEITYLS